MATLKPFPLTELQMRSACLSDAKKYCDSNNKTGRFDQRGLINTVCEEFRAQYHKARVYKRSAQLSKEHLLEMDTLYKSQWPAIESAALDLAIAYGSRFKAREITKVTANHFIQDALRNAGLSGYITCQCYRAKVTVVLPSKYKMMFMIKYKDIMAGKLEDMLGEFIGFTHSVESLPFQVKVWK